MRLLSSLGKTLSAWLLLLIGIGLSVYISSQVREEIEQVAQVRFANASEQVSNRIADRLQTLGLVLRSGAGVLSAAEDVSRADWRAYVEQLEPQLNLPGVQGIGYAQVISPEQLDAHIASVRAEGYPDYTVNPAGPRAYYTSIIYLEPMADRNLRAFGYDMYSEPVRRAAMEQARDSGQPALSDRVTLVQETDIDVQAGTLMYFPVFRTGMPVSTQAERRAALIGWTYSPYRMKDLINGILGDWQQQWSDQINLYIYDGTVIDADTLLFSSTTDTDSSHSHDASSHRHHILEFNGQQWLLHFDSTPAMANLDYSAAWRTFGGMLSNGLLLFGLLLSLISTQRRAERIADGLTATIRAHEKQLADSEFRWKFALEGAGDGLWDWEIPNGKVFFSRTWKEMLGYQESEISNDLSEWKMRVHPDDLAETLALVQACLDGKTQQYASEYRMLCKDGNYKWILDRGAVVARVEDGKPLRMLGTHKDMDSRKKLEQDREQYLKFFRLSPEPLLILEPDGRIRKANPALGLLTGYTEEELLSRPFFDFVHPDDRVSIAAELAHEIAQGRLTVDFENRYVCKDGHVIHLSWNAYFDKAEGVTYVGARDITASKQLRESLKERQRALEEAQRIANVGSWTLDLATGKVVWSEQVFRMLGLDPASDPPNVAYHRSLFAPESWSQLSAALAQAQHEGTAYELELEFQRANGSKGWMVARGEALRDANGKISELRGTTADLTDRVVARKRIEHLGRMYAALSACNSAIVHCQTPAELFNRLCEVVVGHGGLQLAWIGLIDPASGAIVPKHWAGNGAGYLDGIEISVRADDPHGQGPTGTATRENRPIWVEQFKIDPRTSPWHERAARYGWVSSAALPISRGGTPIGALTFYSVEPDWLNTEMRGLLEEMMRDINYALDKFEAETEAHQYHATLEEAEQRFRSLVEQSFVGAFIIQKHRFVYVNPHMETLLGYPHDGSLLDLAPASIVANKDMASLQIMLDKLESGETRNIEHMFTAVRKDGTSVEVGTTISKALYQQQPAVIGLLQDLSNRKVAEEQIKRYAQDLEKVFLQTVSMATNLVEMRDPYTAGHEKHVADIAVAIGHELHLEPKQLEGLRIGGYLHDVGKVTVPAEILAKPGRITPIEYELIKGHPTAGYSLLKDVDFPWPVAQIAYQHHERMDGSGYPQGLKGEQILFEARIIAVADVVESMTSHRPYRAALGPERALAEIEAGRGTKYDAAVVDACLRLFREKGYVLQV